MILLLLLLIVVFLLSQQKEGYYFLWDSHDLFKVIDDADIWCLSDLQKLTFSNHISYTLIYFLIVLKNITGNASMAMTLMSIIFLLTAVISFWKLIVQYDDNQSPSLLYFLLTAMTALSPYFLGMVTYSYPDYAVWCLTPLLYYCAFSDQWIEFFVFGTFFCFLKEPCIIVYSSILLLCYLTQAVHVHCITYHLGRYLVMTVPLLIWLFCYQYIGHWDGSGSFGIDKAYMIRKSQTLFNINFNWLLLLLILGFILVFLFSKKMRRHLNLHQQESFLIVLISFILFWLFSILFQTVAHPRYIDPIAAEIYILAAFAIIAISHRISSSKKKAVCLYVCTGYLTAILTISSFHTIDPIMKWTFHTINVGNEEKKTTIISTGQMLSDGWVYNRQYQSYAIAYDRILSELPLEAPETKIFTPVIYNCTWNFNAMGDYHITQDIYVENEKWNTVKKSRMVNSSDSDILDLTIYDTADPVMIALGENEIGYLLWTDYAGKDLYTCVTEQYRNTETFSVDVNGWIMNCTKFH